MYEAARDTVQRFLSAADRREIVFVRNATEAISQQPNNRYHPSWSLCLLDIPFCLFAVFIFEYALAPSIG